VEVQSLALALARGCAHVTANGSNGSGGSNGSSKKPIDDTSPIDRIREEIRRMSAVNKESPTIPKVKTGAERLKSITALPEGIKERTRVYIAQGRDPTGEIEDPERLLVKVCIDLIRLGVSDELIYGILVDDRYEISKHVLAQDEVERYVLRQLRRGHEFAQDKRLLELNEKHAVIENHGGRCRVMEDPGNAESEGDGDGHSEITLQTFDDFRNRYNNRKVLIGYDKNGNPMEKPLGTWWLDHAARRQYHSITFSPGKDEKPGVYNLWRGFAMKPAPGERHLRYLEHIKTNICSGDEKVLTYLLCWMARAVQKPNVPGEVAVVLRGGKGTGKTVFADVFGRLFGRHYWAVADAKYIVGNFNAHLRDCVVLFGDEAFWAGDKKHESVLKALVTGRTLVIESKGIDAETSMNNVHLIMASNAEWVVPASYDERRFLVLDVAKTRQGDKAYFNAIMKELEDGGFANLLYMLQTMDLSHFNHRDVPATDALQDQKFHSMEPHEEWWYGKLRDGHLRPAHQSWTTPIPKDALIDDYLMYAQRISASRRTNATRLARFIEKCCAPGLNAFSGAFRGKDTTGNPQIGSAIWWEFPPLSACRTGFEKHIGGVPIEWPTIEERDSPMDRQGSSQDARLLS
jgi:hypothetical protein